MGQNIDKMGDFDSRVIVANRQRGSTFQSGGQIAIKAAKQLMQINNRQ